MSQFAERENSVIIFFITKGLILLTIYIESKSGSGHNLPGFVPQSIQHNIMQ